MHIAIIPDGNRRWAIKSGFFPFEGHREGAKNIEKIIFSAWQNKIKALTIWGLSMANVQNRESQELSFLYNVFYESFKQFLNRAEVKEKGICIQFLGEWRSFFPQKLQELIGSIEQETLNNSSLYLTFLLAYSGKKEMMRAFTKIQELKININEENIKNNLMTASLPPVDLVIRTGGEPHWSDGFMMWDTSDSQFYFTNTLWPDFSEEEFNQAIQKFNQIEKRMGK